MGNSTGFSSSFTTWAALEMLADKLEKDAFDMKKEFERIEPILLREGWSVENFEKHCQHWRLHKQMMKPSFWKGYRPIDEVIFIYDWKVKIEYKLYLIGFTEENFWKVAKEAKITSVLLGKRMLKPDFWTGRIGLDKAREIFEEYIETEYNISSEAQRQERLERYKKIKDPIERRRTEEKEHLERMQTVYADIIQEWKEDREAKFQEGIRQDYKTAINNRLDLDSAGGLGFKGKEELIKAIEDGRVEVYSENGYNKFRWAK